MPSAPSRRGKATARIGLILAFVLLCAAFGQPVASADEPSATQADQWPATVSADPLPTAQMNGVAWAQQVVGSKVFVGGEFTQARPAGSAAGVNETPRRNLMAYNLQTGALDTSWAPSANGRVLGMSKSPDGSRLYVVGGFTEIDGQARYRIAAFNTATGALITSWTPGSNAVIYDVKATNSAVYVTGEFSNVGNTPRSRIAALDPVTGAVLPFAPVLEGGWGGRALEVSPDGSKLVVAGSFTTTNGSSSPGRGMAALEAVSGQILPWGVSSVIHNGGSNSSIYSLASDGDSVYGSGYDFGGDKQLDDFEGAFRASWSDGAMQWMEDCHGDTYSVFPLGDVLYTASHTHYCGNIGEFPQLNPWYVSHSLAFAKQPSGNAITPDIWGYRSFTGNPAGKLLHWYPRWVTGTYTGVDQGPWDITSSGDYLIYGGEFTRVSGLSQQGLVRFAIKSSATNKMGPSVQGGAYKISARSFVPGQVRLNWQANYDPDDADLRYELLRRSVTQPLYTSTVTSTYWIRPTMSFVDSTVTPGSTYEYRVRVTDPKGNTTMSDWTSVTVATEGSTSAYRLALLNSGPVNYWPLDESSGTAAYDWMSGNDATLSASGVTRGAAGPDLTTPSKATTFSGSNNVSGASSVLQEGPQVFSVEAWFKTSSTRGGKIVGFGSSATGSSSSYDRHIYLSNSGQVTFGVYPGTTRTITSAAGYNNGQWHQVVGTLGPDGMMLYVDGVSVGARGDTTSAQGYGGYWRFGGDSLGSWPTAGTSVWLNGDISDVAVYNKVLRRSEVDAHWVASGRTSTVPSAPADDYGKAVFQLDPSIYWRLGEASGNAVADAGPDGSTGMYRTNGTSNASNKIVRGQAGALAGVNNTAVSFNPNISGSNYGYVSSDRQYQAPNVFTLETWFKTNTTAGGNLIGFGANQTGTSGNHDRHIYMTSNGTVKFGVWTGVTTAVQSGPGYNNNQWHHVVATISGEGQRLYLDGALVDSNSNSTAEANIGYWRLAGDTAWEGATWWKGILDEVAIYPKALTAAQVQQHFSLGKDGVPNSLPTAKFVAQTADLAATLDGSESGDSDGTITRYAWDFGDGTPVDVTSGANVSHSYAAAGTYNVRLTVTDNRNATAAFTGPVTVVAPNVLPIASFTTTQSGSAPEIGVDASGSTDEGSITSYAWDFGDQTVGSGVTASHSYTASGDFVIKLTVTDDRGGRTEATRTVHVEMPNRAPVAKFGSEVHGFGVNFDAGESSDPDGDDLTYTWEFGDQTTGTGKTPTHTYGTAGTFTVKLTVSDGHLSDSITHSVAIEEPNGAPVAKFGSEVHGFGVNFDAGESSDPDGDDLTYAWEFGDQTTGTGKTPTHTYGTAGTFTVKLTVSDGHLSDSITHTVTIEAPPGEDIVATDTFQRSITNGWGVADEGGAWTVTGGSAAFSVSAGKGRVSLKPGDTREARLTSVSGDNALIDLQISSDVLANGGTGSITVIGRQVGSALYASRLRFEPGGVVRVYLVRNSGSETYLAGGASYVLPGTYTAGKVVNLRLSVTGTSPTKIASKAWYEGSAVPAEWQLQATDSTSALQAPGWVGIRHAMSSVSTNPTTVFSYDNLAVAQPIN